MIPALNVQQYLKTLNLKVDTLNVGQPDYLNPTILRASTT